MSKVNKKEVFYFMDEVMEVVNNSDSRGDLIEGVLYIVRQTTCDEAEVVKNIVELMENNDEYGLTNLKAKIKEMCINHGWSEGRIGEEEFEEEEEEEEEFEEKEEFEEEEELENNVEYAYGYVDDSTIDGKARVKIIKLLMSNANALMGKDNKVNKAIAYHITTILNSLAD